MVVFETTALPVRLTSPCVLRIFRLADCNHHRFFVSRKRPCSRRLSSHRQESNPLPSHYRSNALPYELLWQMPVFPGCQFFSFTLNNTRFPAFQSFFRLPFVHWICPISIRAEDEDQTRNLRLGGPAF